MAMRRISFRGHTLNTRTADMIRYAETHFIKNQNTLTIIQGSYNAGGVVASAGTHDGGGAVDVWLTLDRVSEVVFAMRRVGFAAWHRTPEQGNWGHHVHAIAIADAELSDGARRQVTAYYNKRNGLANNGVDNTWRPDPIPVWGKNFPPPAPLDPDKIGYPGPTPYRLYQNILRKAYQHERMGYYIMTDTQTKYVNLYKASMRAACAKRGIKVDPRWTLYSHTRAFQIAYKLPLDGYPGPVTCDMLVRTSGYIYINLTRSPMSVLDNGIKLTT